MVSLRSAHFKQALVVDLTSATKALTSAKEELVKDLSTNSGELPNKLNVSWLGSLDCNDSSATCVCVYVHFWHAQDVVLLGCTVYLRTPIHIKSLPN